MDIRAVKINGDTQQFMAFRINTEQCTPIRKAA